MKRNILIALLMFFLSTACGEFGTGVGNPPTSGSSKAASAISALFHSEENQNVNAHLKIPLRILDAFIARAQAQEQQITTCEDVQSGDNGPDNINTTLFNDAGSYGSANRQITLGATDFCTLPDGTENSGNGPDGDGLFAAFELTDAVDVTCTDDGETTLVTMDAGSTGVFRDVSPSDDEEGRFPEIYGTFTMSFEGESATVNCTIFLNEDGTSQYADCSDENGESIEQTSDASCQFPD